MNTEGYAANRIPHPNSYFDQSFHGAGGAGTSGLQSRLRGVGNGAGREDRTALQSNAMTTRENAPQLSPVLRRSQPTASPSQSVSETMTPLAVSPAAMFLSAFTPSQAPVPLDAEGSIVSGYALGRVVGYGAFSTIRLASSSSGGIVAVKIVRDGDISSKASNPAVQKQRLVHEAAVWQSLSHEHILPLFSVHHTPHTDYFFTLYCPAGSLFDILKRDGTPALPQDDAGMMFRQVVRGLRYLHESMELVHRDIKLENVLVDECGVCRISDFGMTMKAGERQEEDDSDDDEEADRLVVATTSSAFGSSGLGVVGSGVHRAASVSVAASRHSKPFLPPSHHPSLIRHARHRNSTTTNTHQTPSKPAYSCPPGSLPYAAPELLAPPPAGTHRLCEPSQDIWALGVLLYALLTGRLPFTDWFEPRLHMKILHGAYKVPTDIGRGAEEMLKACLDRTVASRWTINQVDEAAWGVGWGAAGDLAHAEHEAQTATEEKTSACPTPARRSRSRLHELEIVADAEVEERSRPQLSGRVPSSRSVSRAERSQSRAPVPGPTSPIRHRRSDSRSLTLERSLSSNSTRSTSSSSAPQSPGISPSRERGRRLTKLRTQPSRSPSPSVLPTTPTDYSSIRGRLRYPASVQPDSLVDGLPSVLDADSDLKKARQEPTRGRRQYPSRLGDVDDRPDSEALDGLVEDEISSGWSSMTSPLSVNAKSLDASQKRRSGSSPPVSNGAKIALTARGWGIPPESPLAPAFVTSPIGVDDAEGTNGFGIISPPTLHSAPISIPNQRSRSVEGLP